MLYYLNDEDTVIEVKTRHELYQLALKGTIAQNTQVCDDRGAWMAYHEFLIQKKEQSQKIYDTAAYEESSSSFLASLFVEPIGWGRDRFYTVALRLVKAVIWMILLALLALIVLVIDKGMDDLFFLILPNLILGFIGCVVTLFIMRVLLDIRDKK